MTTLEQKLKEQDEELEDFIVEKQWSTRVNPRMIPETGLKSFLHSSNLAILQTLKEEIKEKKTDYKTRKRETPFQDTLFNHAVNVLSEVQSLIDEAIK